MGRIRYLEAIGRTPKRGRPTDKPTPSKADLVRLYVQEGRSIQDVAAALGCSKDMVHYALKRFDIEVRSAVRRSRLQAIDLDVLEAGVKDQGVGGYAKTLGVSIGTLSHHLKIRRTGK